MRLMFSFVDQGKGGKEAYRVDWNYLPKLAGRLHRWMGADNAEHGKVSLYSLSTLYGGKASDDGLRFDKTGGSFFISFYDEALAKKVLDAAMHDRRLFDLAELYIDSIQIRLPPQPKGERTTYMAASPILVREYVDGKSTDLNCVKDECREKCDTILTHTLHTRLKQAGLPVDGKVSFDWDYALRYVKSARGEKSGKKFPLTKSMEYTTDPQKRVWHLAHLVPVTVEGSPETQKFLWLVGAGHSTGIGFGALR